MGKSVCVQERNSTKVGLILLLANYMLLLFRDERRWVVGCDDDDDDDDGDSINPSSRVVYSFGLSLSIVYVA